jgi:hypothetical protein
MQTTQNLCWKGIESFEEAVNTIQRFGKKSGLSQNT